MRHKYYAEGMSSNNDHHIKYHYYCV